MKIVDTNMDGALVFISGSLLEVLPFGTPGKKCPRSPLPVLFMHHVLASDERVCADVLGTCAETPVARTRERSVCWL